MTDAQRDAYLKAREFLEEHFSAFVLVVEAETDDQHDTLNTFWHGGYATALGLANFSVTDIPRQQEKKWEKGEEED